MKKLALSLMFIVLAVAVTGCGFQPIYAIPEGSEDHPLLRQIRLGGVYSNRDAGEGNLAVSPILRSALEKRLLTSQQTSEDYELEVTVTPRARRLAVQIDASVTRFNYQLLGRYTLTHLETNARIRGNPNAVASFNQVNSQYSSLFAEREAVEKAARRMAEEIERDILIQLNKLEKQIAEARANNKRMEDDPEDLDPEEEELFDPDFDPDLIPG